MAATTDPREYAVQCGIDASFTKDYGTDCLVTLDQDKILTVTPTEDWQYAGLDFTVYVTLDSFSLPVSQRLAHDFTLDVLHCETDFIPITESPFTKAENPQLIIIGKDSWTEVDIPVFQLTESRCNYAIHAEAWIHKDEAKGGQRTDLPENLRFMYNVELQDSNYVVTHSYLQIRTEHGDVYVEEQLPDTNVTVYFQAYIVEPDTGQVKYSDTINFTI